MSKLIGSPARCDHRNPDSAVRRFLAPYSIVVEIFVANGPSSNVTFGQGTVLTLVAHCAPIVEPIIRRRFGFRMGHRSTVGELDLLV
jgi:hypothetical protein